jgi:mannosyl-oligosaccharide alpha-1,2-mannosidase
MRIPSLITCLVLSLVQQTVSTPVKGNEQRKKVTYRVDEDRADAVRDAFQYAWDGYYKYAWTHDELHPVAKTYGDSR